MINVIYPPIPSLVFISVLASAGIPVSIVFILIHNLCAKIVITPKKRMREMSDYCKEKCDHNCDADNLVFTHNGKIVYCMGCMHRVDGA